MSDEAGADRGELTLRDGVAAGLLAGATVVLFFFVLDLLAAAPFRTPGFLAGTLFGTGTAGPVLIAIFTVLHFAAFSVIGASAVLLFRWARLPQNMLLGAIYGLFVATLLFYLSLVIAGSRILPAPNWPAVLSGNFLAGLVLGGYLHWRGPVPGITGLAKQLRDHPVLREGCTAGLIGAGVVAGWFLIVDFIAREPLFTPGALGSALFLGADSPEAVRITLGTVLGYTVTHLAGFLLFGVVASGLVTQAEKFPPLIFALLLLFVVFEVLFVGLAAVLGEWILQELAWWAVLMGNVFAAVGMGGYLWKAHPLLQEEIQAGAVWVE